MPAPPSIDTYTVPGGVKLFFDAGQGERDLGNITDLDIEGGTEKLEHFSNRSGKRRKDKVIVLEEKLNFKFKFDEPVIENLKYFFKGGDLEAIGGGTDAKTDLRLSLAGTFLTTLFFDHAMGASGWKVPSEYASHALSFLSCGLCLWYPQYCTHSRGEKVPTMCAAFRAPWAYRGS